MVPWRVLVLDRLPTTVNGKLDAALVRRLATEPEVSVDHAVMEDAIAIKFREAVGVAEVGLDQDFFRSAATRSRRSISRCGPRSALASISSWPRCSSARRFDCWRRESASSSAHRDGNDRWISRCRANLQSL